MRQIVDIQCINDDTIVLCFHSGFYLLHSVPKFPDLRPETFTWNASVTYAQSFLCVSLDANNIGIIMPFITLRSFGHEYVLLIASLASHLEWINTDFFDVHLPPPMATAYPSIKVCAPYHLYR